jgi:putative integral membrane protein (TIGR02587 family)
MSSTPLDDDRYGWKQEYHDLMRAIAGGSIVGLPLLYTMEMWWHGETLSSWHLLALLGSILVLNFLFDLVSGFREEYSVSSAISEAISSVGIGIVFSAVVLWLIGELDVATGPVEWAGKILAEALIVSLGISFANSQFRKGSRTGDDDTDEQDEQKIDDPERAQLRADLRDVGATVAGSVVFAINIAPTEEIVMIATRISPLQLLAMLGFGLLLCYIILFASGFEEQEVFVPGVFQKPWAEVLNACALSLLVSATLLLLLGQGSATDSIPNLIASTVVLGLPAIVGGAAGRIVA